MADQSDCLKSFLLYKRQANFDRQFKTTPAQYKTNSKQDLKANKNNIAVRHRFEHPNSFNPRHIRAKLFIVFDMPTQPPLPPLLTPYVSSLPQSSLTLVSSVLGATGNWLLLRYLYAALSASSSANVNIGADGLDNGKKRKVVLVSFLRGWEFWRSEAKRLVSFSI